MEIKILGGGCPKCKKLEKVARAAAQEAGVDATFVKVTDMSDIMAYDIAITPGLVINETVKSSGRIPRSDEIAIWIKESLT
jgi:small redox-active disulfide protein 2